MTRRRNNPEGIDASSLVEAGILEVIRHPIAIDNHPGLPWDKVGKVTLVAYMLNLSGKTSTPSYNLVVHFQDKLFPKPWPFAVRQLEDTLFGVSTVSGTMAGLAPLSEEQSNMMAGLLMNALDESAQLPQ